MTTTPTVPRSDPPPTAIVLTMRNMEARVDSRLLAAYLGLLHKSVIQTINDHRSAFEEFGKLRFENAKLTEGRTGRRPRYALLNEDQAHLLLALSRNTTRVVDLKVALVKAFRETRTALATYREATLPSTLALQDAIQAVPGGPGPWLYSNIAKLVNTTAGMAAGARAAGDTIKQATLTLMQTVATQAVSQASDAKDAYHRVKEVLQPFGAIARGGAAA